MPKNLKEKKNGVFTNGFQPFDISGRLEVVPPQGEEGNHNSDCRDDYPHIGHRDSYHDREKSE